MPPRSAQAGLRMHTKGEFMPQVPKDTTPLTGTHAAYTITPIVRREAQTRQVRNKGNVIKIQTDNHTPVCQPKS